MLSPASYSESSPRTLPAAMAGAQGRGYPHMRTRNAGCCRPRTTRGGTVHDLLPLCSSLSHCCIIAAPFCILQHLYVSLCHRRPFSFNGSETAPFSPGVWRAPKKLPLLLSPVTLYIARATPPRLQPTICRHAATQSQKVSSSTPWHHAESGSWLFLQGHGTLPCIQNTSNPRSCPLAEQHLVQLPDIFNRVKCGAATSVSRRSTIRSVCPLRSVDRPYLRSYSGPIHDSIPYLSPYPSFLRSILAATRS
jgi:hypothetical protein